MVSNGDLAEPDEFRYYIHHPPLIPLAAAASMAVFGKHEWAGRLVPILFSLGSLILVYLLGTELAVRGVGALAALIFALLPMNAYFGRMLNHEAPTNFFILAVFLAYIYWFREQRPRYFLWMLGAFLLGALSGWPAYYLAGILPVHHIVTAGREWNWKILLLPIAAFGMFAVHLVHLMVIQDGNPVSDVWNIFIWRATSAPGNLQGPGMAWHTYMRIMVQRAFALFTIPVLLLTGFGLYEHVRTGLRDDKTSGRFFLLAMLGVGVVHIVLFRRWAIIHDYWLFYLAAPLALCAAHGLFFLPLRKWRTACIAVIVVLIAVIGGINLAQIHERGKPELVALGRWLREHTSSGTRILMSNRRSPQIWYYAERDLEPARFQNVSDLERVFADNLGKPYAVVIPKQMEAVDMRTWLAGRYSHAEVGEGSAGFDIFYPSLQKTPSEPN